ncbi:MAG: nucleoside 2-deoxyribosyltransferase [Methanothrix sp.]|nr:nucleoside 2-deoxyribosyltransferase [Methanothrix sp.]
MVDRIYLSGPLFSQAEVDWGRRVKSFLEDRLDGVEVLWPHEISQGTPEQIFHRNLQALDGCDLMVAMLDGPQVDDGTAWEIGYLFSRGKRIIGVRTDLRRAGEAEGVRVNLMVELSCCSVARSLDELYDELVRLLD